MLKTNSKTRIDLVRDLDEFYESMTCRGYPDPVLGRVFPMDARGRSHLQCEGLAAALALTMQAPNCVGWPVGYKFPDINGNEIAMTAEDMFRLSLRARVYYAYIWHGYNAVLREVIKGSVRDVRSAWSEWSSLNPWKG